MIRLTIIVPVYNVESYLSKCLDSLLSQDISISEYEILIVNDGSTDNSENIARFYEKEYGNIKLISQENKGLGAARNAGIQEASGACIFFVDSDDYIQINCLGKLLNNFETQKLDLLRFNHISVDEFGHTIKKTKNATQNIVFSNQIVDGETFLTEQLGWACYVWVFLFDAKYLKNNNFLFNERVYFEDVEWLFRVLMTAKRVLSINEQVYFYLQRTGSITKGIQLEKKFKIITDQLYNVNILKQFSGAIINRKVALWCEGMISLTFMGMLYYVQNELPQRKEEVIMIVKSRKFWPLKPYHFTLKQFRDMLIINISPRLYCYLRKVK